MSTHTERRAAALDTLTKMVGGDDAKAKRFAQSMENNMGPLGSFTLDFAMGSLWSRPELNRRDRSIATIASLVCQKALPELQFHVRAGLNHGLSADEIQEIAIHLCAYAGFPTAIESMKVMDEIFEAQGTSASKDVAKPQDDQERLPTGVDIFSGIRGKDMSHLAKGDPGEIMGLIGKHAMEWAFGEVWSRPQLSRRDRSILVVAALTTLGKPDELEIHMPAALNHGVTEIELKELVAHLIAYTGFPATVEANTILLGVLKNRAENA
ncbi:MAG: carboxymuconolactone decarboxylase family protein [Pseudomonadales bacterium]|nr:carboxymuconolactone decarboxylase family protein [Pseudomonadales bacterium]